MQTIRRLTTAALVVSACFGIAAAEVPEGLDRKAISDGINSVKPKVLECAKSSPDVKGKVKVKVVVAPAGTVTTATIAESPDDDLGQCVSAAVKAAKFAVTKKGGSFSYPFMF